MGVNSNPSGEGTNQQTPIGQSQKSSNAWLNIDSRIESGTVGSRPDMGADKYGGDKSGGVLFKGTSAGPSANKESNSGSNEKPLTNAQQLGNDKYIGGTVGSRENMPKYGGESNKGNLVGLGAGATAIINGNDQLKRDMPTQPGQDLLLGTNEDATRNMPKAFKGIGKPGKSGQRM